MNNQFTIALHILGFLASRGGDMLTSEQMAHTYGTSPVVLRRVLAKLQRAGLVETQRGAGGGSLLARHPSAINLREAYEAVSDDTVMLARHPDGCAGVVAPVLGHYVNGLLEEAERAMLERLAAVTVAQMDRIVRARIGRARTARGASAGRRAS